jgi:succinoglycan biosynthesis transport protein ExoP
MSHELEPRRGVAEGQWPAPLPALPQDRFSRATIWLAQVRRYATALRKRWWVFLLSLVAIGGPVAYFAMTRPPTFQSQAMMWLTGKLNLPSAGLYAEELSNYIGTQADLFKGPILQWRAFERVRAQFPAVFGTKTNTALARLPFALTVRSSMKSSVLELRVTGPSSEATQAFLDALMDEYLAFKKDSRKRTSSGALSGITDQIHEAEEQIQHQQQQVTLFQMSNNISYLSEHGLSAGSHLSKLVELLSDLRTEQHLLELLTPAQFKGLAQGSQVTLSDKAVPGEKAARALAMNTAAPQAAYYQALQQIEILKAKRDEFARVLRPTHSKMVKLNQEIAGLEQLLKTLQDEGEERALAQMADRKKALGLQVENLESQYRAWETNAAEASRKLAEYDRMKQEMLRSQALYDRLLSLLQTVDLNNNLDQEPLVAMAPASPARPTLTKYRSGAAGLVLAFVVGLGAFFVLELLDDRFRSVQELSLNLPVRVVGQIPNVRRGPPKQGQRLLPANAAFAESFRNLRSCLLFMSEQDPQPKVILVTSAIPKEGKTTVASNLAITLALSGARVLLVDADFHRGSVHRIFNVGLKPGLLEVLSQGVAPAQAIVPTAEPNLYVLPAGKDGDTSSDLFLRCRVDLLLKDLAGQFNYIVVDSSPVLATDAAACLGPFTDGVFMVVRAGHTSSRMASEALDRLLKRNSKVLGVIYNRAPASTDYYCHYTRDYYRADGPVRPRAPAPAAPVAENLGAH